MDGIHYTSDTVYYVVGRRVFAVTLDQVNAAHRQLERTFRRGRHPYAAITKRMKIGDFSGVETTKARDEWVEVRPDVQDWCDWCDEAIVVLDDGGRLSEVGYILPEDAERVAESPLH